MYTLKDIFEEIERERKEMKEVRKKKRKKMAELQMSKDLFTAI